MASDTAKIKRTRTDEAPKDDALNVRKAVRFASKGRGGVALAKEAAGGKTKRKSKK
jgi:regulator of ribosome biosynthesis